MKRPVVVLIGASMGVLAIAMAFGMALSPKGDERLEPTSFSTSPSGTRGIYEALRAAGTDARRWRRPYDQLPDDAILIMAGPQQWVSAQTWQDVLQPWVVKGGTLILATGAGIAYPVHWYGDISIAQQLQYDSNRRDWRIRKSEAGDEAEEQTEPQTEDVSLREEIATLSDSLRGSITVTSLLETPITKAGTAVAVDPAFGLTCDYPGAVPLLADDEAVYAWFIPMYDGRIILTATPGWLMNRRIAHLDNLQFLLNIIDVYGNVAPVYFDERVHGYAVGDRQVSDLWRTPAWGFALAQTIVLLVWYGLSNGLRFGPRRLLSREANRSTMEFVDAMGNLYRRANMQQDALRSEWRRFRVDIARRYGIDPKDRPRELVSRLSAINPASAYMAEAGVRAVGEALRRPRLDDAELVSASRALAELRSEVL